MRTGNRGLKLREEWNGERTGFLITFVILVRNWKWGREKNGWCHSWLILRVMLLGHDFLYTNSLVWINNTNQYDFWVGVQCQGVWQTFLPRLSHWILIFMWTNSVFFWLDRGVNWVPDALFLWYKLYDCISRPLPTKSKISKVAHFIKMVVVKGK